MRQASKSVKWLGVFCALLLASCGRDNAPKAARQPELAPRDVRLARAEMRPMKRVLRVVGTLAARDEATIGAQVAGQLAKLYVDLGDTVKAGQDLALVDTDSYEALANASAANVDRAKASAANAVQNLKRIQDLQKDQIASTSDLDAAVAEATRAQSEVRAAEANDAIARLNLERSHVRAPFDGVVAARLASAGDYLAVGTRILSLVQIDPLRLRLEVPEREWGAARLGQSVTLLVEGDTNAYRGEIARIAPTIRDDNRMLLVEADVPNRGQLRAGLFARAQIVVSEHDEVLSVPAAAVITFAGLEKVVIARDGKAVEKAVTTGRRDGEWIEIVAGLAAGESVVLNPAGVRTGQPLTVGAPPVGPASAPTNASR